MHISLQILPHLSLLLRFILPPAKWRMLRVSTSWQLIIINFIFYIVRILLQDYTKLYWIQKAKTKRSPEPKACCFILQVTHTA